MSEDRKQSTFVTVVAWIFIALSGFGTVISILQNIMVQTGSVVIRVDSPLLERGVLGILAGWNNSSHRHWV